MPRRQVYADVVTYSQAHLRLKNDKGRPSEYPCVNCGEPAREWAYMGGCPNEVNDGAHGAYSLNQNLYEPMCVSCHRRHDRALADGRSVDFCPKGHPWDEANTGIRVKRARGTGLRFCRACNREHARRSRINRLAKAA